VQPIVVAEVSGAGGEGRHRHPYFCRECGFDLDTFAIAYNVALRG
jgi:hypothetical protein